MSQNKQSAIEAAAHGIVSHLRFGTKEHAKAVATKCILAYLSALVEDEGTVLAVTIAIATTSDVSPEKTEDYEAGETTNMYDVARAVLRTLATRAQGESS